MEYAAPAPQATATVTSALSSGGADLVSAVSLRLAAPVVAVGLVALALPRRERVQADVRPRVRARRESLRKCS